MGIDGFLFQWCGAWGLATLMGRWSPGRRWRTRWLRAARVAAVPAAAGGVALLLRIAAGGVFHVPGPDDVLPGLAAAVAALGSAGLWSAGRLEGGGRRRIAAPLTWLGGMLSAAGCLALALLGVAPSWPPWWSALPLALGFAALLASLSRKPRPTGTLAAAGYLAWSATTAWGNGGW